MKYLQNIAIRIGGLCIASLGGTTFAIELGDCNLITDSISTSTEKSFSITKKREHHAIIDPESINIALLNLKKSCCENKEFGEMQSCKDDKELFLANAPQSYYLFDHLFDVLTRRLDGIESYPGMKLDPKGQERREAIREDATNPKGTTPAMIDKKYQEARKINQNNLFNTNLRDVNLSKAEYLALIQTGKNLEILNNYENRTLGERYENVCTLATYMYFLFIHDDNDAKNSLTIIRQNILKGICGTIIENRLNGEAVYIQTVKTKSSNGLSLTNLQEYTSTYLGKRMEDLQSTLEKSKVSAQRVERATTEITLMCS